MDKDTLKGKAKDVGGRIERQAGEWTGSEEHQVKGAAKQAEGKVQNAFGKAKDKINDELNRRDREEEVDNEREQSRKTA